MVKRYTYNMEALTRPVADAIRFAFKLEPQNDGETIPWDGPELRTVILEGRLSNTETLEHLSTPPDGLDKLGGDLLERIVEIGVAMGIEQGFRMLMDDNVVQRQNLRDIRRALEVADKGPVGPGAGPDRLTEMRADMISDAKESLIPLERFVLDPGMILREGEEL